MPAELLKEDLEGEVRRAALLEHRRGVPDVDVVMGRELGRLVRVVAGAHQLVGAPALDALDFSLDYVFYSRHGFFLFFHFGRNQQVVHPHQGY
jgi:hypothetical protein